MNAEELITWLTEKMQEVPFGEIRLVVRTHQGKPALVERSVTERLKLDSGEVPHD